ncbi:MAG: hypothetical protein ACREYE_21650 [Gammaproteobacteria bacterium]
MRLRCSVSTAAAAVWTLLLWLGCALQVEGGSADLDPDGLSQVALNDLASPPLQPTSGPGGSFRQ